MNKLLQHRSFVGCNFEPNRSTRTFWTFFQDLSSQAIPISTNLFLIEADEAAQFEFLCNFLVQAMDLG